MFPTNNCKAESTIVTSETQYQSKTHIHNTCINSTGKLHLKCVVARSTPLVCLLLLLVALCSTTARASVTPGPIQCRVGGVSFAAPKIINEGQTLEWRYNVWLYTSTGRWVRYYNWELSGDMYTWYPQMRDYWHKDFNSYNIGVGSSLRRHFTPSWVSNPVVSVGVPLVDQFRFSATHVVVLNHVRSRNTGQEPFIGVSGACDLSTGRRAW